MNARKTIKREVNKRLVLQRITLSTRQTLTLNRELCIGCEICEKTCPEKAVIKFLPPTIRDGRLVKKGLIHIDADKCTFCGECAVLCPLNAIKIEINGEEKIPVVEAEAFPTLRKEIAVDVHKCDPTCNLLCQESCPTEAIQVIMEKAEPPKKIINVKIDKQKCIFCKHCELACPQTTIHVTKPVQGFIQIDTNLCPKECEVCVDICPSKTIMLDEKGKPAVAEEFCIYCGACQEACPEKAITMRRTHVLYSEVESGAWTKTLENLTSYPYLVKELSAKSVRKIREAAKKINRF